MSLARALAATLTCVAVLAAAESDIDWTIRGVLARYLRFTISEFSDLQGDKVVRHGLDSGAAGEVGVVGAVKVPRGRPPSSLGFMTSGASRAVPTFCRLARSAIPRGSTISRR